MADSHVLPMGFPDNAVVLNAIQFMRKVLTLKWKKTTSSVLHVRFSGTYYSNRTSSVNDFRGNVSVAKNENSF